MSARKSAETNPQPKAVDVPDEVTPDVPKVPSIMGSTFAERAAANKAVAKSRAEAKG